MERIYSLGFLLDIDFPIWLTRGVALGGSRGSTEMHPGGTVTSESSTPILLPPETPVNSEKTFCTPTEDKALYFQKLCQAVLLAIRIVL